MLQTTPITKVRSAILLYVALCLFTACAKNSPDDKTCPQCDNTDQVIPIVYGEPSEQLIMSADSGKVMLGGCVVEDEDWYCKRDGKRF